MAKLNANTLLVHPETGESVLLASGGDVPGWATGLIGEHLLAEDAPAGISAPTQSPQGPGRGQESAYDDLHLPQLRAELERRGLPATGNKPELIDRLEADDRK